ncbi:hypothetical protein EVAR_26411_1 [Eumeta japonica]|uniref:Uncharacterized protein n=1 Tax=Eumeta variegata TaxID=151549 RepID=A0A4C1VNS2_EUMVA|nr:hypothetical protein EVAR_26411_1 [Eumeta japonica]
MVTRRKLSSERNGRISQCRTLLRAGVVPSSFGSKVLRTSATTVTEIIGGCCLDHTARDGDDLVTFTTPISLTAIAAFGWAPVLLSDDTFGEALVGGDSK